MLLDRDEQVLKFTNFDATRITILVHVTLMISRSLILDNNSRVYHRYMDPNSVNSYFLL